MHDMGRLPKVQEGVIYTVLHLSDRHDEMIT